jgi:hypothetical protein
MPERKPFAHEATIVPGEETDRGVPGAAITVGFCGYWQHEGQGRWPHNSAIEMDGAHGRLRTIFVAPPEEETIVRELIDTALREGAGWGVRLGRHALCGVKKKRWPSGWRAAGARWPRTRHNKRGDGPKERLRNPIQRKPAPLFFSGST